VTDNSSSRCSNVENGATLKAGEFPHIGSIYLAFDTLFGKVAANLARTIPGVWGYSQQQVQSRFSQRIIELTLTPYVQQTVHRYKTFALPIGQDDGLIKLGGIVIDAVSGELRINNGLWFRSILDFLKHWLLTLWFSICARRDKGVRGTAPLTIILGVGNESTFRHGSDLAFSEFCLNGPITPLCGAGQLVVESSACLNPTDSRITYRKRPILSLLSAVRLPFKARIGLLYSHFCMLLWMLGLALKKSPLLVLSRDLAYLVPVLAVSEHSEMTTLIVTTSAFYDQPLWTRAHARRRFSTHMVWYSQNIVPVAYQADGLKADNPGARYLNADEHWVWTDGFARYLKGLRLPGKFNVAGPILWYLREEGKLFDEGSPSSGITIGCFDITPISGEAEERLGLSGNYYSTENAGNFIRCVAQACALLQSTSGRTVNVLLKHKREYGTIHDHSYIDLIQDLAKGDSPIKLLSPETSIYSMLNCCDVAIVMPYSSPAYIASSMKVPAIFFDPTARLLPTFEEQTDLYFCAGENELRLMLENLLAQFSGKSVTL